MSKINQYCFIISLIYAIILLSCSDEPDPEPRFVSVYSKSPIADLPDMGLINFNDPQVGQRSYYLFTSAEYFPVEHKTVYHTSILDTLVIAIAEQRNNKWVVREFIKSNTSRYFQSDLRYNPEVDTITGPFAEYQFRIEDNKVFFDSLDIRKTTRPSSFFRYRNGLNPILELDLDVDQIRINDLALPYFGRAEGQWYAYTPSVVLAGRHFDGVFSFHDHYIHQELDRGFGQTIVYSANHGLIASYLSSESDHGRTGGYVQISR